MANRLLRFEAETTELDVGLVETYLEEIFRLQTIAETFQNIPAVGDVYDRGLSRIHACAKFVVKRMETLASKLPNGLVEFCLKNEEFTLLCDRLSSSSAGTGVELDEALKLRGHRAIQVVKQFYQATLDGASSQCNEALRETKEALGKQQMPSLKELDMNGLQQHQVNLISFSKICSTGKELSFVEKGKIDATIVFVESSVVKYFGFLVDGSESVLQTIMSDQEASRDAFFAHQKTEDLLLVLSNVEVHLRNFRGWSPQTAESTSSLSDRFFNCQHKVFQYNASLKSKIEEIDRETEDIINQASNFLKRLRSQSEDTTELLKELGKDSHWGSWAKLLEKQKRSSHKKEKEKQGWFARLGMLFGSQSARADPARLLSLEEMLNEIHEEMHCQISKAVNHICQVQWDSIKGSDLVCHFFKNLSKDVLLFIEFLGLQQSEPALADAILNAGRAILDSKLADGEVSVTSGFLALDNICRSLISNQRFEELDQILAFLRVHPGFSDPLCALLYNSSRKGGSEQARNRRLALVKCVENFPNFESFKNLTIKAALQLDGKNISFLNHPAASTPNEHGRLQFYERALADLESARTVTCLARHISDEHTFVRLQGLPGLILHSIAEETQRIGDHVVDLLSDFPSDESNFTLIYVWLGNLSTLQSVFLRAEPTIAGQIDNIHRRVERLFRERLDTFAKAVLARPDDILYSLLVLKKAAIELCCWHSEINTFLDRILLDASNRAPNPGRYLLTLSAQLNAIVDSNASYAGQILSDHTCFEGSINSMFNNATARQDIDYVIRGLDIPAEQAVLLKKMYTTFHREYSSLVRSGLKCDGDSIKSFLKTISKEAKVTASDLGLSYESQLVFMTAQVFAYWSLQSTNFFSCENESNDAMAYLKQPHAAQVVAVWTILNFKQPNFHVIENKMCELQTGEGKSIVLGVSATLLAMMGCHVDCICYSKYLSNRDYNDFKKMFCLFGVKDLVDYGTIDDLCEKKVFHEHGISDLSEGVMLGPRTHHMSGTCSDRISSNPLRVLLIDEVDIFFKEDFFGKTFNPVTSYSQKAISDLIHFIWENQESLSHSDILETQKAKRVLSIFPSDVHALIRSHIKEMHMDAKRLASGNLTRGYSVVHGKISYKYLDGRTFSHSYGYETTFAYLKEYQEGRIEQSVMEVNLSLKTRCGQFSYAELPTEFDLILGITGTLRALSPPERSTLETVYNIHSYSYIPSVYGKNKLQFAGDNCRDVILCDSKDDHFLEIRAEINRRRKSVRHNDSTLRSVMVFFRSKEALLDFYDSEHMADLKTANAVRAITEEIDPKDKDGAFLRATEANAVTLLIREYGRGTDFKCFDSKVLAAGGVHVIQAFFSKDIAEEIQLKGRAARQGEDGSFSMVLSAYDLSEDLGITPADIEKMRKESSLYSFLDKKRRFGRRDDLERVKKTIDDAEKLHYETLSFIQNAESNRRSEALAFLFERNGIAFPVKTTASQDDVLSRKEKFKRDKMERLRLYQKREKERRQVEDEFTFTGNNHLLMLLDGNAKPTHYDILGVPQNAPVAMISKAFRRLSLIYHPDKTKNDDNANNCFLKISKAREILCEERKRAAYDESLRKQSAQSNNH